MRKLYSFVLLGLLASTNPIFAMDLNDGTDTGVEIDKFSAASPTNMAVTSSKVVPEGSDVPWYDDEVASGSPAARGRAKSMDKGGEDWEEGEGLLEELAARSAEATKDPLASSVVMSAANQGRFSPSVLAMTGDEEKEGSLPNAAILGRQTSAIGEETIEGETPTAVAAPLTTYFESVPDRETAETVLTSLRKNLDVAIHIQIVVHYLYHPTLGSGPADGFDLNVFANQLSTCKTADEQSAVLSAVERTYVEKAFTQLIIDQDAETVNQLKLVMNYVYDPDNAEKRAEGFDVINFESELSGCETLAEQQELLNQMENEYGEAWDEDSDGKDAEY